MRQTPFGVWNFEEFERLRISHKASNEADAFWRLESGRPRFVRDILCPSNEADAFWRLESFS